MGRPHPDGLKDLGGGLGAVAALAAGLSALAVYLPSLGGAFVNFDDYKYVRDNPELGRPLWQFLQDAFGSFYFTNWTPLTLLSYWVDHALWGMRPAGYHLTNVLLHAVNSGLVVLLALVLFERVLGRGGRALFAAFVAGAAFALHPLHVESVAWISERKDVLYSLFWLLCVLSYLRYASDRDAGQKALYYCLSLLLFALSLMSKPMAVTLPAVLLLLDWYPLRRLVSRRAALGAVIEKLPFFLLSAGASYVAYIAQEQWGTVVPAGAGPVWERVIVAVKGLGLYVYKTFLPMGLSPFYPLPRGSSFSDPGFIGASLLILGLTVLGVMLRKRRPVLLATWAYLVVSLLPVIGLVQVGAQGAADRYMYLPVLGPLMAVSAGAALLRDRFAGGWPRPAFISALSLTAVLLAAVTVGQTLVWRDSYSLWGRVVEVYPESSRPYYGRAQAYHEDGRLYEALSDYNVAVRLEERYAPGSITPHWTYLQSHEVYYGRAQVYLKLGRYEEALADLDTAITIRPSESRYYLSRADARQASGRLDDAIEDYGKAISLKPDYLVAYNNMGSTYVAKGDYPEALRCFSKALALGSRKDRIYFNRARVYEMMGDRESAVGDYRMAADLGVEPARVRLLELGAGK